MRVNIYAEEMTDKVEIVTKKVDGQEFTGVRFYLELPVTVPNVTVEQMRECNYTINAEGGVNIRGPFMHQPGDDDSSAITFWGKRDLKYVLQKALEILIKYETKRDLERKERNK